MGIYDRNYYRDETPPGLAPSWNSRSPVSTIIIICVICFFLNLFFNSPGRLSYWLKLDATDLFRPQYWWHFLTYGFAHSERSVAHLVFNMATLWFLGRSIEERYGWAEFWRIYIISVIFCGLAFAVLRTMTGSGGSVVGASGAVLTITMLFVFNYPRSTLHIFGVFPIPAWVLGLFIVIMNFAVRPTEAGNVAYDVHAAGIIFAAIYFYGNLNFDVFGNIPATYRLWKRKAFGPKLKKFDGEVSSSKSVDDDANRADQLLEKIQNQGMDSLSAGEKKFLENYSKKVREKQKSF